MSALESYIAPAGARRGWWRPLAGLAIILLAWLLGTVLVLVGWAVVNMLGGSGVDAALGRLDGLMAGREGAEGIAVMLATFVGIWLGAAAALSLLHGQRFMTLFAPDRRVHLGGFLRGLALALVFTLPSVAIGLAVAEPVRSEIPFGLWAIWLGPIALLIFVQATGEELIFRGYLLQQLALRSRWMVVWAGLPSLGFGLMHLQGGLPEGAAVYYVAVTFLMGLTLAALVWRSGSLWPAAGLHVGVNLVALTVLGAEGPLAGTQLWLFAKDDMVPLIRVDLALTLAMLGFVLSPLGRIFGTGEGAVGLEASGDAGAGVRSDESA